MHFDHLTTVTLDLMARLQWLWYSAELAGFVVGDDRKAFLLRLTDPATPTPLESARPLDVSLPVQHPCNLPVPESIYDEFRSDGWCGFEFLPSSAYDHAVNSNGDAVGDLLRTLVFGPDYGHFVLHRASNLVVGFRSGTIELLQHSGNGFVQIDETRTRGRAALAFAGHPTESLIAYGDNYGNFHTQRFSADGFGKAKKIAAKERKASALQFVDEGRTLIIGGAGYLTACSCAGDKLSQIHEEMIAVRSFAWIDEPRILFVNQGLHGVTAFQYDDSGFSKTGAFKPDQSVQQMAVSRDCRHVAISRQHSPEVSIYAISEP